MFTYKSIPGLQGKSNRPGLKKRVYIAALSAFETIEKVVDPDAADETRITIAGDHTFPVGEGFIEFYTTLDTAKLMAESVGERDGKGHNPKVEFFHPGIKAEAMAFADACQSDEYIVLVETLEGEFLQLGEENIGVEISSNFDSGTVSSGRKGWSFVADTYGSLKLYTGTVTVKPVV